MTTARGHEFERELRGEPCCADSGTASVLVQSLPAVRSVLRLGFATSLALASACSTRPDDLRLAPLAGRDGRQSWVIESADGDPDADAGPAVCAVVQLVTSPQKPDVMIVLDRSTSMEEAGRWRPSVAAVRGITSQLESVMRFGLTLFPSTGLRGVGGLNRWFECLGADERDMCLEQSSDADGGGLLCSPGEIVVPVADDSARAIANTLSRVRPNGGTPTSDTLRRLVDSYAQAETDPDALTHEKYLLLVTDGAPTCPEGEGLDTTDEDVAAANAAIEALREHDVRTYVVGYGTTGPGNEALERVLDGFAARGGTGDEKHRPVEDEASLVTQLESIATSIASCDFELDTAPSRAEFVLVQLDGETIDLNDPDGWRLVGTHTIQLVGNACERFREGSHSVTAELRCELVTPS
jgi:hypothetical protein